MSWLTFLRFKISIQYISGKNVRCQLIFVLFYADRELLNVSKRVSKNLTSSALSSI